ncbi:hypothetical protein HK097_005886, partial [Rhizophlyctis rosea]
FEDSDEESDDSDLEDPEEDRENSDPEDELDVEGKEDGDGREPRPNSRKRGSAPFDDPDLARLQNKRIRASERRRRRRRHTQILAEYYGEGTSYGMAIASVMYTMALQLGRASNDLLWLAIVGLTDHYLHERVSQVQYDSYVTAYREEVSRLNLDTSPHLSSSTSASDDISSDLDSIFGDLEGDDSNSNNKKGPSGYGNVRGADDFGIRCEEEMRVMLLRHWSLYESFYFSTYVATRVGVWTREGKGRLGSMMVKMGLPHREAQQLYREMSLPYKKTLRQKLTQMAPNFNLPDLFFTSFHRAHGYKGTLSAPDAVHSLTALLDCGQEWKHNNPSSHTNSSTSSLAEAHAPQVGRVARDVEEE